MSRSNLRFDVQDLAINLTIAAGATVTLDEIIELGICDIIGLDWKLTGTPNVDLSILQSNVLDAAAFTLWSNPTLAGTSTDNTLTINTGQDGTDLILAPSALGKIRLKNNDGAPIVVNYLRAMLK